LKTIYQAPDIGHTSPTSSEIEESEFMKDVKECVAKLGYSWEEWLNRPPVDWKPIRKLSTNPTSGDTLGLEPIRSPNPRLAFPQTSQSCKVE
jgi:hypothetical protein